MGVDVSYRRSSLVILPREDRVNAVVAPNRRYLGAKILPRFPDAIIFLSRLNSRFWLQADSISADNLARPNIRQDYDLRCEPIHLPLE